MLSDPDDEIVFDAREVALDILDWQTTEAEWVEIAELLAVVVAAVASGDLAALRTATVGLEALSPERITRLGEKRPVRTPPPEPVRERVNRLVHELDDKSSR